MHSTSILQQASMHRCHAFLRLYPLMSMHGCQANTATIWHLDLKQVHLEYCQQRASLVCQETVTNLRNDAQIFSSCVLHAHDFLYQEGISKDAGS